MTALSLKRDLHEQLKQRVVPDVASGDAAPLLREDLSLGALAASYPDFLGASLPSGRQAFLA
jgi:hypothetical protein